MAGKKSKDEKKGVNSTRVGVVAALWTVCLLTLLLPSRLVSDDLWLMGGMSAIAEWKIQRRITGAVKAGAPCTAVAAAYSSRSVDELVKQQLPVWTAQCERLGAKNHTPVIVRISPKDGGVDIDARGADEANLKLPIDRLQTAEDQAFEQIGADHYEAVAWIAVGGVIDDASSPPWYMATRDRWVRSLLRWWGWFFVLILGVLSAVYAFARPGAWKEAPVMGGSLPSNAFGGGFGGPTHHFGGGGGQLHDYDDDD